MTQNDKLLLSCLTIPQVYHDFAPYVKDYFSNDSKKLWLKICKYHSRGVEIDFPELDKPPKGAEHIVEDMITRYIITQEIEDRVFKLNSPDLLLLEGTTARAREVYKDRRVMKEFQKSPPDFLTGVPRLDGTIEGFNKKELNLIAAPSYGGKTHWLVFWSKAGITQKLKIVYVFCEDTPNKMAMYFKQAGVSLEDIMLLDYSDNPPTLKDISEIANEEKPDIFVIDYIDLLAPAGDHEGKRFELESLYQGFRQLANKHNFIALTASQTDIYGTGLEEAKVIKRKICDVIMYWKDNYLLIDKARGRELKSTSIYLIPNWNNFTIKEHRGI